MPIAVNGSGTITGISVGGLPDGIVDTDMLANNAVTAAKSSGLGITMHDVWTISSSFNAAGDITSNLVRANAYQATIGSAMTESSGVFTFPSTGLYEIVFNVYWRVTSGTTQRYLSCNIKKTVNNSSYTLFGNASVSISPANSSATYEQSTAVTYFDVTDTANQKIKFNAEAEGTSSVNSEHGNSYLTTYMSFTRLGDT